MRTLEQLDARDSEIIAQRMEKLNEQVGPRVGDFIRFPSGELRRVSYIWREGFDAGIWGAPPGSVQTTDGTGSFYLGEYGCSYSGSLHPGVPDSSLSQTNELLEGPVWIFHHDYAQADNGVITTVLFRVFNCDREAPR